VFKSSGRKGSEILLERIDENGRFVYNEKDVKIIYCGSIPAVTNYQKNEAYL
jgi:hypothetical protein